MKYAVPGALDTGVLDATKEVVGQRRRAFCVDTVLRMAIMGFLDKNSLPCVKKHKEATGCSGKRDKTGFTSIADFDDTRLHSGKLTITSRSSSLT